MLSAAMLSRAIDILADRHGVAPEDRRQLQLILPEYIDAVASLEPSDRRRLESRSGVDGNLIQMDVSRRTKEEIFEDLFGDRNTTTKRDRFYTAARNMGRLIGI